MDCDHTTARERPYVWFAVFTQGQVPCNDATYPIPQNSSVCLAPLGPIHQVPRISNVRAAFGPIHFRVWMGGKHFLHPVWLAKIPMPRNRPGVFAHFLIVQFTNGPAPQVIVVINQPYLR